MEKNQIVTPKTKRMIKASYIINLIMFAIIAFMLIPLTVEDGQVYLPSYEKSLLVLLVLAFVAAGLIAFALDRIGKKEKETNSEA
ncbi:MAG: hypothetical protein IKK52_05510 [Alphaproteobacteria bacterium]|nr:hypothetical protein [Alphaproteobacteria bacterium]